MLAPAALTATAILATFALAGPAGAQDFSCREASNAAERTICSSSALKDLDERMARVYGWVWDSTPHGRKDALRNDQRAFLAARNGCGDSARCLGRTYLDRIGMLTVRLTEAPRRTRNE